MVEARLYIKIIDKGNKYSFSLGVLFTQEKRQEPVLNTKTMEQQTLKQNKKTGLQKPQRVRRSHAAPCQDGQLAHTAGITKGEPIY